MVFYLSEIVGTGADAEGNEIRPAVDQPGLSYSATYGGTRALVSCETLPVDARWATLDGVDLEGAHGVPISGLTTLDDLAQAVARRFAVRQFLRSDDLPSLGTLLSALPSTKIQRVKTKLVAQGIDISGLALSMTVREALAVVLPQIRMRPFARPSAMAPRGTFTDNFTRADENLEASANWTRVGGVAGAAAIRTNAVDEISTAQTAYQCPDQASADHYTQVKMIGGGTGSKFQCCVRLTDTSNFIGFRTHYTRWQLYKRNAGTFTLLGTWSSTPVLNDIMRLEASGNSIEAFVNSTSRIGPITDSFNNTETRQGLVPRNYTGSLIDDFEAAVISSGPVLISASDSLDVSITESTAVLAALGGADGLGVSIGEAAAVAGTVTAADSLDVSLGESTAIFVPAVASDSLDVAVVEGAAIAVAVSAADSLDVSISDQVALPIAVAVAAADTLGVSVGELASVFATVSAQDLLDLAISEGRDLRVTVAAQDALDLSLSELAAVSLPAAGAELTATLVLGPALGGGIVLSPSLEAAATLVARMAGKIQSGG